ncbi:hypothetical protein [Pseudomonas phage vB_Pa-PAC2]
MNNILYVQNFIRSRKLEAEYGCIVTINNTGSREFIAYHLESWHNCSFISYNNCSIDIIALCNHTHTIAYGSDNASFVIKNNNRNILLSAVANKTNICYSSAVIINISVLL